MPRFAAISSRKPPWLETPRPRHESDGGGTDAGSWFLCPRILLQYTTDDCLKVLYPSTASSLVQGLSPGSVYGTFIYLWRLYKGHIQASFADVPLSFRQALNSFLLYMFVTSPARQSTLGEPLTGAPQRKTPSGFQEPSTNPGL